MDVDATLFLNFIQIRDDFTLEPIAVLTSTLLNNLMDRIFQNAELLHQLTGKNLVGVKHFCLRELLKYDTQIKKELYKRGELKEHP